jgi:hypothetical protein
METVQVKGVDINLDNLRDVKNQKALKATDIFTQFSEDEQAQAYSELWLILKPESKDTPPPAQDAAIAAAGGDVVSAE